MDKPLDTITGFHAIADVLDYYNAGGTVTVKVWAQAARVSERVIYDYMQGHTSPRACHLITWLHSRRIPLEARLAMAGALLAGSGIRAIADDGEKHGKMLHEAIEVGGAAQELIEQVDRAGEDGQISPAEQTQIGATAARVQSEAADVAGLVRATTLRMTA